MTDTFSCAGIHIILRRNGSPLRFSFEAFDVNFKNQELISYCDEASNVMEVFKPTSQLTNSMEYILSFIFEGNAPPPPFFLPSVADVPKDQSRSEAL